MHKNHSPQSGIFTPRAAVGFVLCLVSVLLAILSLGASNGESDAAALNVDSRAGAPLASKNSSPLPTGPPIASAPLNPASPGWSVVTAPKASGPQQLQAITCVSESDCWAVGYYVGYDTVQTELIEHWDGSSWAVVNSPNHGGILYAVTCASSSQCWAVGYSKGSFFSHLTLIEKWDGVSWAVVNSPNNGTGSELYGVTCTSTSQCWAVGSGGLIEKWDGNSWTIVASPTTGILRSVTCTSPTQCWAVGISFSKTDGDGYEESDQTLIERWDGASWTIVSSPNPGTLNELYSVTCTSSSQCWAVGRFTSNALDQTLVERWDGDSWTVSNSPNRGIYGSVLTAISCASTSHCWAAGNDYVTASYSSRTLIEEWNGSSWTIVDSPNRSSNDNYFYGLACTADSQCLGVGFFAHPPDQTLIEKWDGVSWSIIYSPNHPTAPGYLYAVSCASPSQCMAVGSYYMSQPYASSYTLTQQWNGSLWTVVDSPSLGATRDSLNGVTCISATDCWAVGGYDTFIDGNLADQTHIERWDGNSWTTIASPNVGTSGNFLHGVTCTSASNCWAVGTYATEIPGHIVGRTLIEKWDGNSWTIVSSPNMGMDSNYLYSVVCTSESQCWAVGTIYVENSGYYTLTEKWDGNSWTIANSQNTGTLQGVTCTSPSQCWAVGNTGTGGPPQTLIKRWDGISWSVVNSPNPTTAYDYLYGVTCTSASQCWAVGQYLDSGPPGKNRTLIERWDGSSWTFTNSPNPASSSGFLYAVTCSSDSQCWTVGTGGGANDASPVNYSTLIEQYSLTVPPLTGVASRMMHGAAGNFDINLPLTGSPGVECRDVGGGNYNVVFTFANAVTNCGSAGAPGSSVMSGPNPNQCTESLTGVPNAQYINITLNNVLDSQSNSGNISVPMGVLIGDTSANGVVNSSDVAQTKSRVDHVIDPTNFRSDVNANGTINASDVSAVKWNIGSGLP